MKKIFSILILIIVLCVILLMVGWKILDERWNNAEKRTPTVIEVPAGASVARIARILKKHDLIRNTSDFRWYIRLHGLDRELKTGSYEISGSMSLADIAQQITRGDVATRKLTIPEGRASWEIFSILKRAYPHLDSLLFEKLVHDRSFCKKLGLQATSLEGYLFPDTYILPLKADEKTLLTILVRRTLSLMASQNTNSKVFQKLGFHGVLTLASIVEEESGTPQERGLIAGVFLNRLRLGIPLGADPTVRFIFRSLTGPIYQSQLDSNSPYNTRRFRGLPPGPISSPGLDAIRAVLSPQKTRALYFVAKEDGTRTHYFAESLKEHNVYRKKVAASRRQ